MSSQIESKIREILQMEMAQDTDVGGIGTQENLVDYGMNSTIILKTIMRIEKELDIQFNDDDFDEENFRSIEDMVEMVERKRQ